MLWFIISMVVFGLIVGWIAGAVVPGDNSMGIGGTILLGIAGSFVGGFLFNALFVEGDQEGFQPVGLIGSILGAIAALLVVRWLSGTGSRRGVV